MVDSVDCLLVRWPNSSTSSFSYSTGNVDRLRPNMGVTGDTIKALGAA